MSSARSGVRGRAMKIIPPRQNISTVRIRSLIVGEASIYFCFAYLLMSAIGGGPLSLDSVLSRIRKRHGEAAPAGDSSEHHNRISRRRSRNQRIRIGKTRATEDLVRL